MHLEQTAGSDFSHENSLINDPFFPGQSRNRHQLLRIRGTGFGNRLRDKIDALAHIVHYGKSIRDLEFVHRVIHISMKNAACPER
jgi:hypothetical protein